MNEFDKVNATMEKIFKVLNEAKLSGMTIYYMMKDITQMIAEQLSRPVTKEGEHEGED